MMTNKSGRVQFFQFPHLNGIPKIFHAVFSRHGGYSQGPFQGLNVSYAVGDDPQRVAKNRAIIAKQTGSEDLFFLRQVHGRRIYIVSGVNPNKNAAQGPPPKADAVITNVPGKMLTIQVADCQSILLFDPCREVIANIHAGWRGSINGIVPKTVAAMQDRFDCCPEDMLAGVGPSLGPCCAEFVNYRREIPSVYWRYKDSADRFDFWAISRDQLCRAGLAEHRIIIGGVCTRCDTERFFSYRAEGRTGRLAAVIGLLESYQ